MSNDAKSPHYALMDVGSTVVKLAELTPAGEICAVHRFGHDDAAEFMERWNAADILRCYVAEPSDKQNLARLEELLERRHVPYRLLRKAGRLPIGNHYAEGQAGIDRLANAVAVHRLGSVPAVVVDAGSAVTVDLMDAKGHFVGGCILPGIGLQMWALSKSPTSLPGLEAQEEQAMPEIPGRNTAEAIRAGVLQGLRGAIDHLVEECRKLDPSGIATVVFTGGDGELFSRASAYAGAYERNLTLDGLWAIAQERFPEDF